MYLVLAGMVSPWFRLPDLDNIGFTLVFVRFALAHCASVGRPAVHSAVFPDLRRHLLRIGGGRRGNQADLRLIPLQRLARSETRRGASNRSASPVHDDLSHHGWVGRAILRGVNPRFFSGRAALAVVASSR